MLMAAKSKKSQRGINLIELMIGIAISLVILTGVLIVMVRANVSGGEVVQSTRLNQQMRGTLDQMSKELQRAGYVNWQAAWGMVDVNGDGRIDALDYYQAVVPVLTQMGRITIAGSCILYSYDLDNDGARSADQFELFGFRLNNGAIETKVSGAHDCQTNQGWQGITDSTVTITELTFALTYVDEADEGDSSMYQYTFEEGNVELNPNLLTSCNPQMAGNLPAAGDVLCLARRSVEIAMAGQLADDAAVTMELNTKVKIRNDHFNSKP